MNPRDTLIAYLLVKVGERDWHGVSDAANDLRVLEAKQGEWLVAGGVSIVAPDASQEVDSVKPGAKPANQGDLDEKG